MIEYALQLDDGTQYSINGNSSSNSLRRSTRFGSNSSEIEATIIERSYGEGAVLLGDPRLGSQKLTLTMDQAFETDAAFKTFNNALIAALMRAEYLLDLTNEVRTRVSVESISDDHDEGAENRSVTFSAGLVQLTPYWENIDTTVVSATTSAGTMTEFAVNNGGAMDVPAVITFTVAAACSSIELLVVDTDEGTLIEDDLFGTGPYSQLEMDNQNGTLLLFDSEDSELADALGSFADGSGFFRFPAGASTVNVLTPVAADIVITFRERFYR